MNKVWLLRGGAVAAACLLLAGCTPSGSDRTGEPTTSAAPYSAPEVVGETVSASPLESDEWVVAARAGQTGFVLASNAADFSIEPFVSAVTADYAENLFRLFTGRWVDGETTPLLWPGPPILLPLEISPVQDDRATVRFCDGSDYWQTRDEATLRTGVESTVTLVRTADGIRAESSTTSRTPCDATGAPIAVFDPAPRQLPALTTDDVTPPPGG